MKRTLPWILTCIVAGAAAAGLYSLTRRHREPAPPSGPVETSLFAASPAGSGAVLTLQPSADQPLRTVRFLPALSDGEVLVQVLTQTGDQIIGRFKGGRFTGTIHPPLPEGMSSAFFRFARLQDAAPLADGSLLLLYGDGTGSGSPPWLMDLDTATQTARWALKVSGVRIAMEAGGQSCLLWDSHTLARADWNSKPSLAPIPLPDGVTVLDAVLALPDGRILLAHPGGLAAQAEGDWTLTPLPDPGDLAFPGAPGALAPSGDAAYWQPRPGQLARIGPDGSITPVDLSKLAAPAGHAKDLALLRLAGADARGRLWFVLATPDFTVAPRPMGTDQPSAALQAAAALTGAPLPAPASPAFDPGPWMDYLKGGLDRAYGWDPATSSPRLVDWKADWATLGAPAGFTLPLPRNMQPKGGALLLDQDTRAWWLPLDRLAP